MHEAALMAGLMRRINELTAAEGGQRVLAVSVRLGALSHMSGSHFAEHFSRLAAGTPAEGARLDITVCDDVDDPDAQHILLERIEVEG